MTIPAQHIDKMSEVYTPTAQVYDMKIEGKAELAMIFPGLALNFHTLARVPIFSHLDSLTAWPGKHRHDMPAPNQKTINTAKSLLRDLYCYSNSFGAWSEPNVTVSTDGEIVFEWWHSDRKLTIYVTETGTEYIKVWGLDIFNEMEDGDAQSSIMRQELWSWLMG